MSRLRFSNCHNSVDASHRPHSWVLMQEFCTPRKTNEWLAGKFTMNEDIFPIENGWVFNVMLVFRGVSKEKTAENYSFTTSPHHHSQVEQSMTWSHTSAEKAVVASSLQHWYIFVAEHRQIFSPSFSANASLSVWGLVVWIPRIPLWNGLLFWGHPNWIPNQQN